MKAKVLLVEDNEMNRDVLSRRLAKRGYEIVIAVDGEEAIEKAASTHPALILLDLGLPGINGVETAKILKADIGTRSIPIIALTAHAMDADRQRALEAGCNDFDTKPVELRRLLAKMETLLR